MDLTRAVFEEVCDSFFKKVLFPVRRVLRDADIAKKDVHEIILVGGSTRIPRIRAMLRALFHGKELNTGTVHPDEAVAYGAAVQAANLSGAAAAGGIVTLLDVVPLSLASKHRQSSCHETPPFQFDDGIFSPQT